MKEIEEGRLTLRFAVGWNAIKWDADASKGDAPPYLYREGIEKLNGELDGRAESTKAVDVVASPPEPLLVLIEIKDFRSTSTGEGARFLAAGGRWRELPLEIALKVRDTLAGVYGTVHLGTASQIAWLRAALHAGARIVALVPQDADRPREPRAKRVARDDEMLRSLRRRLAWLTRDPHHIAVIDRLDGSFPHWLDGLSITST